MALFHCHFRSDVLGVQVSMDVILPQPSRSQPDQRPYQTLYLLHGLSDDHTIWQRRTSIERYVDPLPLAVVMPAVNRSFYTDMADGYRYGTFIADELPALARSFFPLSDAREDNFVAGLSMGGYGAFKLALTYPDRYAAAASLSGAVNIAETARRRDSDSRRREMEWIFGDLTRLPGSKHDLLHLAEQIAQSTGPRPRLYQWCGTDDFLYAANLVFRDHARALGLDLTYEEGPGGHEWLCWDRQIQRVLEWLPLRRP
jgi:putative tributyrin esterase